MDSDYFCIFISIYKTCFFYVPIGKNDKNHTVTYIKKIMATYKSNTDSK